MKSNIQLAIRNILKNKVNSFITIGGLTVAFACLLLIYMYVSQEFSYNNFHSNKDKIFRANYSTKYANGREGTSLLFDSKLSGIIKDKVPQVNKCTAFRSAHGPTLIFEENNFEEKVCIAEPDFFDMFSFKLLIGNKEKLFENPDEIVITSSLANKFQAINSCTKEELMGQHVFFQNTGDQQFVISGIMEDVPKNSSIQFDALIPYKYEAAFSHSNNTFGNSSIFYEINQNEDAQQAELQINETISEYYKDLVAKQQSRSFFANTADCFVPFSLSLNDVYLSKIDSDYEENNSKTSLYILSAIGFLILIIACSNYMMLSLSQAFKKVGEVGIRKAIGARPVNIFGLFFTENIILTFAALAIGAFLCTLLLPIFNQLAYTEIYTGIINISQIVAFVALILSIVVLTTSLIPILKLTKIQPNLLLSKNLKSGNKNSITQLFVTLQYVLSIILIILTISIVRQTNYMKYKDLGFSAENIIDLRIYHLDDNQKIALRDELRNNAGIVNFTLTDRNYTGGRSDNFIKNKEGELSQTRLLSVDHNYISTLSLKLTQGDNFAETSSSSQSIIINEKLLSFLGFKDDAIGQSLSMDGKNYRIMGVVKDFHYDSMKEEIQPLVLLPRTVESKRGKFIFIKYNSAQLSQLIPFIQKTWKRIAPDKELDFKFWDEQLNQRYQSEERWSQIIGYAAIIAIIISSLGLFGLTLIVINRRVKEIGIRKISGAKVMEVITMLNKDFIKWVAIAFVIACPLAYYVMHKWLENFAYKTPISWWVFALAGLLALGIALLTVSWQSWRAATRNPVEALRYE
ncbi:MAG: ABC transporter permease [Salinivirgaceae bacterium]|nr:ABC transporter permease [Salinivirgaceae bacterium]